MRDASSTVSWSVLSCITAMSLRNADVAAVWNGLADSMPSATVTASASSTEKPSGASVCDASRQ